MSVDRGSELGISRKEVREPEPSTEKVEPVHVKSKDGTWVDVSHGVVSRNMMVFDARQNRWVDSNSFQGETTIEVDTHIGSGPQKGDFRKGEGLFYDGSEWVNYTSVIGKRSLEKFKEEEVNRIVKVVNSNGKEGKNI